MPFLIPKRCHCLDDVLSGNFNGNEAHGHVEPGMAGAQLIHHENECILQDWHVSSHPDPVTRNECLASLILSINHKVCAGGCQEGGAAGRVHWGAHRSS